MYNKENEFLNSVTIIDKNGEIKIGTMICYDREFPGSAKVLMLNGAEIILVSNVCPMDEN